MSGSSGDPLLPLVVLLLHIKESRILTNEEIMVSSLKRDKVGS